MSESNLCECDAEGCQAKIYDRCESCKLSFCEQCIEGHPCIEIIEDSAPNVASMPAAQEDVQPAAQPAVKKRKLGGVIVKSSIRNYYGVNDIANKKDATTVSLVSSKAASWVWSHFMRYNSFLHADMKNTASCNLCHLEAKTDTNIKYSVEYKVRRMLHQII